MADNETEIYITWTVTTEYHWSGPISDLPPAVRKGVLSGRGEDRQLDEDQLQENLTDEALTKLTKRAEQTGESIELDEVGEA